MKIFYSRTTGGFFHEAIHGERGPDTAIPTDAVEVTPEAHADLMERQAAGMVVVPGPGGAPIAVPPVTSMQEQLASLRQRRNRALAASDWSQLPDALDESRRDRWRAYRQQLRDLPATIAAALAKGGDQSEIGWPAIPE